MLLGLATNILHLEDSHGAALADYEFYPDAELMYVHWHGHLTGTEVIRGVEQGTHWRDQLRYSLVLNDKRDTSGDWREALPWLQYEWLPRALGLGLRAMAYVFSPDRENQFASQEFVAAVRPHLEIEVFDNPEDALAWLLAQPAGPAAS
ncbi:STAS/SEC14 domain-containing protein [Hymenobacter sp.]|uniref:STAS/SEC14 domain-containing protein n=1 Tax=Hymenobacter sp. TaxID=1898978 RepID=UPI00286C4AE9|nr:hypothetical protein [Hymenobacter sp.]